MQVLGSLFGNSRTAARHKLSGSRSPFIAALKILFAISSHSGLGCCSQRPEHARSYTSPKTVSVSGSKVEPGRINFTTLDIYHAVFESPGRPRGGMDNS